MKQRACGLLAAVFLAVAFGGMTTAGQSGTADTHIAAARAAAGKDHAFMFETLCVQALAGLNTPAAPQGRGGQPAGPPARAAWYAEPVKVFDNLYFVGTKVHGAWAVTTSDGIIVIDALYDYAAEPEIADGLKKLGLDPTKIKYVVISHGHGDHHGGAKFLQDQFAPHLILSATDWDMVERDTRNPVPPRDMVATDGQKLTLGGETLTLYITPGHTPGTISTLVPVKEAGQSHLAAEWGGTVITPATPIPMLQAYVKSATRFRDVAEGAGADVIITNHTAFDGTLTKLDALRTRKPGDPNPYIVGKDAVRRYLIVAEECGKATLAAAQARQ